MPAWIAAPDTRQAGQTGVPAGPLAGYKTGTMTTPDDLDPLTSALESVTRDMARRMSVRIDRLVSQAADLAALEEQLATLEAELPPEPEPPPA